MDSRIVGGGMGVCFLLSNTSVCSIHSRGGSNYFLQNQLR